MKKFFTIPVLALVLAGCSNNDPGSTPIDTSDIVTNYLSIKLVTTGDAGTRDDNENPNLPIDGEYTNGDGSYQDGTGDENAISLVRFYFFAETGQPAYVINQATGDYISYYDYDPAKGDGITDKPDNGHDLTVEKILNATIIINTKNGDRIPHSVIAIANPPKEMEGKSYSITALNDIIQNYHTVPVFVMSNSIYADSEKTMEAVEIKGKLYHDPELAKKNPVVIFIERVLAKVSLNVSLQETSEGSGIYSTGSENQDHKPVYVKFLGWNITGTADKSRLIKAINPKWDNTLFGDTYAWNIPQLHRSFWAINPPKGQYSLQFGAFIPNGKDPSQFNAANNLYPATGNEMTVESLYLQENAAIDDTGAGPEYATKVIIAAQLVDINGNAMEIAEWGGTKTSVENLKQLFAQMLKLSYATVEAPTDFIEVTANDITFVTQSTVDNPDGNPVNNDKPRYHVYAQLTPNFETLKIVSWKMGDNTFTADNTSLADINAKVRERTNQAQIWKNGYTYYYFDIRHLGETMGEVGIVRNHWYKANVNKLSGLGTPVYDEDEVIYPETPTPDSAMIAAEVQILSWRIVAEDYDLNWGDFETNN